MAGAFHVELLLKYFRVCTAQVELGTRLVFNQIVQKAAIKL